MFAHGPVILQSIPGRYEMRVMGQFVWSDGDRTVRVPPGFVTDGASIPRFFWRIIGGPFGPYRDGAVVHDYLYRNAGLHEYDKLASDTIFNDVMHEVGIKKRTAWMMYRGVRMGGRSTWNEYLAKNR